MGKDGPINKNLISAVSKDFHSKTLVGPPWSTIIKTGWAVAIVGKAQLNKPESFLCLILSLYSASEVTTVCRYTNSVIIAWPFCFYSKTGFWPSYCQISTDLEKNLHTPIVVRNTLVGRLRPWLARGRLQAKPERLCFFSVILVTHPKSYIETTDRCDFSGKP